MWLSSRLLTPRVAFSLTNTHIKKMKCWSLQSPLRPFPISVKADVLDVYYLISVNTQLFIPYKSPLSHSYQNNQSISKMGSAPSSRSIPRNRIRPWGE